jgi:hypothetical protein
LGILGCLPFVFDSSLPGRPAGVSGPAGRRPRLCRSGDHRLSLRRHRGPEHDQPDYLCLLRLLGPLPRPIRVGLTAASIVSTGIFLSGMVTNPAGNSVKTDSGYALKLKDGRLVAVTKQQCLENSRAKRRVFLEAAIWCNARGGALCWATKLCDDEEDPL